MKPGIFRRLINLWPPFLGAGIKIKEISEDYTDFKVEMKLTKFNRNYVGTQFGGSIYAMTDPFYMLILMKNLGKDYIVWDKAADIRFKLPGKGKLTAHFNISKERIAEIKAQADKEYKVEPRFTVHVKDEQGNVVAEIDKVLYVRRKDRKKDDTPKGPTT
jgi:acyl-coenzyme A thioesterase PaaI-like protein